MNRIKELREARGWNQKELADLIFKSRQAVGSYETDSRGLDEETIHKLCDLFGVTADYLLCRSSVARLTLTDAEWAVVSAYNRASLRDRDLIDRILAAYQVDEKGEAAQ